MKTQRSAVAIAGIVAITAGAQAGILFSDSFDAEHAGSASLNYSGFANWSITRGTADVIGNGNWDLSPDAGHGIYVDLDGSTGLAARMASVPFALDPGDYELSFQLAGSQRGDTNTVHVSFLDYSQTIALASNAPFTTFTAPITVSAATSGSIVFDHDGGDNIGLLLDNVELRSVPSPSGGGALAILAVMTALRRRR